MLRTLIHFTASESGPAVPPGFVKGRRLEQLKGGGGSPANGRKCNPNLQCVSYEKRSFCEPVMPSSVIPPQLAVEGVPYTINTSQYFKHNHGEAESNWAMQKTRTGSSLVMNSVSGVYNGYPNNIDSSEPQPEELTVLRTLMFPNTIAIETRDMLLSVAPAGTCDASATCSGCITRGCQWTGTKCLEKCFGHTCYVRAESCPSYCISDKQCHSGYCFENSCHE